MPKNRRTFAPAGLLLGVLASALPGAAQPGSPFIVDTWNTQSGLPGSVVISMAQTRDGYLWLGTQYGLVRFDGIHFTVFDEENTPGLANDQVVCLFQDSHTNLWIGMDAGDVALLHNGRIRDFEIGRGGEGGRLASACEDSSGAVWLYTADAHLGRWQNGKMEVWNFNFNPAAVCRRIVAEKSGSLWIGEDWGLFSFHPSNFHPPAFPIEQLIRARRLDFILASRKGGTWRLINGRVQKWGPRQLQKDFGPYPWTNVLVKAACEDADGNLIVGTLGAGIFWYQPDGKYRLISTDQGLSSAYVLSLCLDSEGNLWAGTDGGGLDRIKRNVFSAPSLLPPWSAQSISEDAQGGLWIAYGASGAAYWKTNAVRNFHVGLYQDAWEVLVDVRQRVWAGTRDDGLFLYQTNQFQHAPGAGFLGPAIYALFEDAAGQLWVGAQNGLANWNGRDWKWFTTREGLSQNAVRALAQDAGGRLWIGTQSGGLNCLQNGRFAAYRQGTNGPPGNDISCLYAGGDGILWIGTSGHGLGRFDRGKWTAYSTRNGLASDHISYITEDHEKNLWIGSNAGLMRVPEKSLDAVAAGQTNVISCRTYVEADGLPARECSGGSEPAVCSARDGRLWFPTTKGAVAVNPAELKPNPLPPRVIIESAFVDGREQKTNRLDVAWSQSVVAPPGRNQLKILYTALDFAAPDQVRFRYRLEGRDAAWTEAGDARAAFYSELPPGHYRFHVQACNEDGVWNRAGAVLDVTVQPEFWQTPWFRAAGILALAGIVITIVRYFSTQKLHRQLQALRQREALERERARIARDLHDQLGANLTQVALLGEMAEADKETPAEVESHARQICQTARETTHALDEIVWAVNPANDTLEGLVTYACKYAQEYLALAGLRYRADLPVQLPVAAIPPEVRHNVFLAFKEAVNNVVKHARAAEARIRLRLEPDRFVLEVEDDGRGLAGGAAAVPTRNGLRNMRKRMEDIRGEFSIGPGANGGTLVRLVVPLK
ncbi:MAG: ATP-binding protein [Verrucomicrobiota bacterium]|nr:ATP-binding protein [Verrucomicrobiota bacterium]